MTPEETRIYDLYEAGYIDQTALEIYLERIRTKYTSEYSNNDKNLPDKK